MSSMKSGSFSKPMSQIAQEANEERTKRLMDEHEKLRESEKESEEPEQKSEIEAKVDSMLPEKVMCLVTQTEMPYAQFRARYEEVFDGVRDKEHFVSGYCKCSTILGGVEAVVRTLRSKEARALEYVRAVKEEAAAESLMGAEAQKAKSRTSAYNNAAAFAGDSDYFIYRLVMGLVRLQETQFDLPAVSPDNVPAWLKREEVKNAVAFLEDRPNDFMILLGAFQQDIMNAYQYALIENTKNP
jgi:hypothetical protein